jgi:4'-phosphopantetheinyl transferase
VHLWWGFADHTSRGLHDLLSPIETARLERFRRTEDRHRFTVGCALVRLALSGYLRQPAKAIEIRRACQRCGGPHGKPRLIHSSPTTLQYSVSHTGRLVGVAFAGCPLGLDVEAVPRAGLDDRLRRRVLSTFELSRSATLPSTHGSSFLTSWTRKEACLKAVGVGLSLDLRLVCVSLPTEPPQLIDWPLDVAPDSIRLRDLEFATATGIDYVGAIAVAGPCETVKELDGTPLLRSFRSAISRRPADRG